ncbi:MAG: hypothetical protein ACQETJ_14985 [Bacteroidota bacterium]
MKPDFTFKDAGKLFELPANQFKSITRWFGQPGTLFREVPDE